jgi:hypothetical protein
MLSNEQQREKGKVLHWSELRPRIVESDLLRILLDLEAAKWPMDLKRFQTFQRDRDGPLTVFRPVVWDPEARSLYVRKLVAGWTPQGWMKLVLSKEETQCWLIDDDLTQLHDMHRVDDFVTPRQLLHPENLGDSCHNGVERRRSLVEACLYFDTVGDGKREHFVFNSFIFTNKAEELSALRHTYESLGEGQSFSTFLRQLIDKFIRFGGIPGAFEKLSFYQGAPKELRTSINHEKPGPKSFEERQREVRNELEGTVQRCRRTPIRERDLEKFREALEKVWASQKLATLREAYDWLILNLYKSWTRAGKGWLLPSYSQFCYHAKQIIARYDLKNLKKGFRLAHVDDYARVGSSSDLTDDLLEIIDVDGFQAKIAIAAVVKKRIKKIYVKVIFAVSRLSGAILGWEIALEGEKSEAFRRCIADVYLPKYERARDLGLESTDGLLHGSADGLFVDNGAGASEPIVKVAVDQMGLIRFLPPPRRGDYKGVGEGVNGIMVSLMRHQRGGFTRAKSNIAQEDRFEKNKLDPITLGEFELLLWQAIQHYNLHTNKSKLRTRWMRDRHLEISFTKHVRFHPAKQVGISPADIFEATQEERKARGMVNFLTEDEVLEKFIPWEPRAVARGKVRFCGSYYTSQRMVDYYEDYARQHDSDRNGLTVKVKRRTGSCQTLLWICPDGSIGELGLCDSDERSAGQVSWKGLELFHLDDKLEANADMASARESLQRLRSSAGKQISNKQQGLIDDAVKNQCRDFGGLVGESVNEARKNADNTRQKRRQRQKGSSANDNAAFDTQAESVGTPNHLLATSNESNFLSDLLSRVRRIDGGNR